MNREIAVLVADDQDIVRDGLAALLDAAPGIRVLDTQRTVGRPSTARAGCVRSAPRSTWC
jgi:DNA-binding NarL/FixJ family response regulator